MYAALDSYLVPMSADCAVLPFCRTDDDDEIMQQQQQHEQQHQRQSPYHLSTMAADSRVALHHLGTAAQLQARPIHPHHLQSTLLMQAPPVLTSLPASTIQGIDQTRRLPLPSSSSSSSSSPPRPRSTDARKLAAMNRASMACVPCRDAKHKCDGSPPPALLSPCNPLTPQTRADQLPVAADKRCSRCVSHNLDCVWLPRAKLGRPLKRSRAATAGNANKTENAAVATKAAIQHTAKLVDGKLPLVNTLPPVASTPAPLPPPLPIAALGRGIPTDMASLPLVLEDAKSASVALHPYGTLLPSSSLPHQQMAEAGISVSDVAVNHAIQSSIEDSYHSAAPMKSPMEAASRYGDANPIASAAAFPYAALSHASAAHPYAALSSAAADVPMPLITTDVSTQSNIRTGLKAFFTHGPRFCLAFIPAQEARFLAALDRWSGILLNVGAGSRNSSQNNGNTSGGGLAGGHETFFASNPADAASTPSASASGSLHAAPVEARDALTLAQLAACIGWKMFRHDYAQSIHSGLLQAARQGLRDVMSRPLPACPSSGGGIILEGSTVTPELLQPPPNWQQMAYTLQALLLGCTIEYGLDHVPRASELLNRATAIVLALDLRHFDVPQSEPTYDRLCAQTLLALHQSELADDFRRIFWELCVIQTMLTTSTTGNASLCLLNPQSDLKLGPMQINFPGGDGPSDVSDYGLRIRAASLLLESVQAAPPGASRMPRMQSLKTMLTNLAVYARHRFVTAETEQALEVAYTACLMLNAAKVQLVRLTFFPAWNYALKSCAFEVGGSRSKESEDGDKTSNANIGADSSVPSCTSTMDDQGSSSSSTTGRRPTCVNLHWPKEHIRNAILDIVQAADDIMELTELDNKPRWRSRHPHSWEPSQTPLLSHSPFHACPQVVAAFGYRAAATLYKDLAESAATPSQWGVGQPQGRGNGDGGRPGSDGAGASATSTSPASSSACGPSAWYLHQQQEGTPTTAAGSGMGSEGHSHSMRERYNDAIWRHRAVLSNMSLAHTALVSGSALWPIAGRLAAEVGNCRRAVDHDGPSGMSAEMEMGGTAFAEGYRHEDGPQRGDYHRQEQQGHSQASRACATSGDYRALGQQLVFSDSGVVGAGAPDDGGLRGW